VSAPVSSASPLPRTTRATITGAAGLTGTGALLRLALRRDRVLAAVWVALLVLLPLATASAFRGLYPDVASRLPFAAGVAANGALRAVSGPPFDLTTIGGLTAWRVGGLNGVLVALMNVFTVTRHTRAEEESGRSELLGAGVVGRAAAPAAALLVAAGCDVLAGLVIAAGLAAGGEPVAGSVALGAATAAVGLAFAGISLLAAQLTGTGRTANGIGGVAVAASFLLRAAGDAGSSGTSWLSWLSPIGWGQQVRPYVHERWWVLVLPVGLAAGLAVAAAVLLERRDLGAGLLADRAGPGSARARFGSPLALARRLHRGPLLGWAAGLLVGGLAFGAIAGGLADLFAGNAVMTRILAQLGGQTAIVDGFVATTAGLAGLLVAAYAVSAVLRARVEEVAGRAEPVLVAGARRTRWLAGHLLFGLAGPVLLLAAEGLGAGLVRGLDAGGLGRELGREAGAALVQLPAVWVLAGLTVAVFGLLPRAGIVGWVALVLCVLLGQLGELLSLPQWALDLSPFTHLPKLPAAPLRAGPVLWLTGLAATLVAAGIAGFRRRDLLLE
jgi:ABC-2 type transport system permease protein